MPLTLNRPSINRPHVSDICHRSLSLFFARPSLFYGQIKLNVSNEEGHA